MEEVVHPSFYVQYTNFCVLYILLLLLFSKENIFSGVSHRRAPRSITFGQMASSLFHIKMKFHSTCIVVEAEISETDLFKYKYTKKHLLNELN